MESDAPLRLMVEYAADSPLWTPEGNVPDPAVLGVDADLARDLVAWQRDFDAHYSVERDPHWDDPEAGRRHVDEARALLARLQAALPGREVTLVLWADDPG